MSDVINPETVALKAKLDMGKKSGKRRLILPGLVIFTAILGLFAAQYFWPKASTAPVFKFAEVTRGDIRATVSATGTLQPTNKVDVGSELSGTIDKVFVDYNDKVVKGQLLAHLNTEKLQAQVLQSKAALQVAKAGVLQAEAALQESQAQYERLLQVQKLSGGKLPSKADMISAEAARKKSEAAKMTALAQVEQAKASLEQVQTDLGKANIISPINGIVLERSIEPGQTVAATMSAPVLFSLAEDLTSMELQVDVDEADVGQVLEGQKATFTVDAYPNVKFPAVIKQVRYGAQSTDGVVTYTTLLEISNQDMKLRPGMTATAEILVKETLGVRMIPQAALRFIPALIPDSAEEKSSSIIDSLIPKPRFSKNNNVIKQPKLENGFKQIWHLVNNQPQALLVKLGDSDGAKIEIVEGDVQMGDKIIVGVEVPSP